jgi:GTP pyrophosphokinase
MTDAGNDKFSDLINDEKREREMLTPGNQPPVTNFSADRSLRGLAEAYTDLIPENQRVASVRIGWQELWAKLTRYMGEDDLRLTGETFAFSANAHSNQFRYSGEPYIVHALGTAAALADMQLDMTTLQAALLHDVVEDTDISADEIERKFGPDVRTLVEGVTKLSKLPFKNVIDYQSENLRKMFLVMAKDIRVVLIKLADRMHNMSTIQAHKREKQLLIAQETLDIYAPLAHRLGIYNIKRELEDSSFRVLNPEAYYEIRRRVRKKMPESEEVIKKGMEVLSERLKEEGVTYQINGRPKHYYSIYEKMNRKSLSLDQIYDLLAMRVVVETLPECYHALGIVHSVWKPIPGQFDDYIANPKDNMYQSLHTTVVGPTGVPLEIQIRTREMHSIAEYGIAAHWQYKEQKHSAEDMDVKLSWIRNAIEEQRDSPDSLNFLEHIKTDVLTTEVFLFTPQGKVISLPSGSTPIDFAYAVHTQVGHRCVGAMVNGRIVPMDYELKNGEIVRVLTSPQGKPSRDWLKIVKSNRTRNKIKAYFRQIDTADREEKAKRGRELIEHEIARRYTAGEQTFDSFTHLFGHVANDLGYTGVDEMLAAVGNSRHTPGAIVNRASALKPKDEQQPAPAKPVKPV